MDEEKSTEKFTVSGKQVAGKIKQLVQVGNVRRVRVIHKGKRLFDIPLSIGLPATAILILLSPILAAIAMVTALITECTIEVEKTTSE
ncbi:MAG: DUF4342 domain-containing protein [Chloroflexi bacterium]|nr:DUF4342 domain-containing protein [Chloroflexota bacterium]